MHKAYYIHMKNDARIKLKNNRIPTVSDIAVQSMIVKDSLYFPIDLMRNRLDRNITFAS